MNYELCSACEDWYKEKCSMLNKQECPLNKLWKEEEHAKARLAGLLEVRGHYTDPTKICLN